LFCCGFRFNVILKEIDEEANKVQNGYWAICKLFVLLFCFQYFSNLDESVNVSSGT
jgi:hypothetical protein